MKLSKWGLVASSVYLIITAGLALFATSCSGFGCSGVILLLMLPWVLFIDESGFGLGLSEQTLFWSVVALNIIALYLLFALLERWMKKR